MKFVHVYFCSWEWCWSLKLQERLINFLILSVCHKSVSAVVWEAPPAQVLPVWWMERWGVHRGRRWGAFMKGPHREPRCPCAFPSFTMSGHRRGPSEVQIPEPSFWNSLQSYEKLNSVTCGLLSILEQQYGQTTQSSLGIFFPLELIPVCYMIVLSLSLPRCALSSMDYLAFFWS